MKDMIFFKLGLSFLVIHEMDAIRCREWRILPGLSSLEEKQGFMTFLLLHIPLMLWIFIEITYATNIAAFKNGFDAFMIIHFGLHLLLLRHKNNEFRDWISWFFIVGPAILGFIDLLFST